MSTRVAINSGTTASTCDPSEMVNKVLVRNSFLPRNPMRTHSTLARVIAKQAMVVVPPIRSLRSVNNQMNRNTVKLHALWRRQEPTQIPNGAQRCKKL
jgi:hypothetical protein